MMHASLASQDNTRYLDAAFLNFGVPKVPGQRSPPRKGMIEAQNKEREFQDVKRS